MCWVQVQTEVMGDIHHYAWRARLRNQTVYIDNRDGERFGDWTSQQCAVRRLLPMLDTVQDAQLARAVTFLQVF